MKEVTGKEAILKNIRNALLYKSENPFAEVDFIGSVYNMPEDTLDLIFAEAFTKLSGKFVYCGNQQELKENLFSLLQAFSDEEVFCSDLELSALLKDAGIRFAEKEEKFKGLKVGISSCEFLIARSGSIMVSSSGKSGRRLNVYPEIHVVIAKRSCLVPDIKDAWKAIEEKYEGKRPSMISVISGPSRTADIEKTLVMGAHGPRELYLFLLEDQK